MAPLLNTLISRIVLGQTKKSRPDLPRPASITFSEGDFPGGHQQYGGYTSQPSSLGNSPIKGRPHQAAPFSPAQDSLHQPSPPSSSPRQEHMQVLGDGASLSETESLQAGARQSLPSELAVQTKAGESETLQSSQQQRGGANVPLNRQKEQQGNAASSLAPQTSGANQGDSSRAKHGYNGNTDSSDEAVAATSGTWDAPTSGSNDSQDELAQASAGISGTEQPTDMAGAGLAGIAGSAKQQESFAELVQGTEQLLGMLASRDVS